MVRLEYLNSTTFERSYSVSDAYRIQLCLGSPRFGRQNLACPYSSLASVYMKRSTKSAITFYPLAFAPQELLHRDHSEVLRLDRWSDTTLRCSPSFQFPSLLRSPVLFACFGFALASYRSVRAAFCVHGLYTWFVRNGKDIIVTSGTRDERGTPLNGRVNSRRGMHQQAVQDCRGGALGRVV